MGNIQDYIAHYHLPGLFEFYDLYRAFLPLWREHRDWFYDWCDIRQTVSGVAAASASEITIRRRCWR